MRDGNFRKRLTVSGDGVMSEIAAVFNEVADRNLHLTGELSRVRRMVGREGKLTERLETGACEGVLGGGDRRSNALVDDLVRPVSEVGPGAVGGRRGRPGAADGAAGADAGRRRASAARGVPEGRAARSTTWSTSCRRSPTRSRAWPARSVTEGKLGGQAQVRGMSGSWKDLTDSVNTMAYRLTAQVRDIALVTTAVAKGDLSRKVTVHVAGEMLELKNTVNTMVDQLSSFSVRGDAGRPRGGHRGRARRPGAGARRRRGVEGPHRFGQPHGRQPDGPGARDRAGDDGGRQR